MLSIETSYRIYKKVYLAACKEWGMTPLENPTVKQMDEHAGIRNSVEAAIRSVCGCLQRNEYMEKLETPLFKMDDITICFTALSSVHLAWIDDNFDKKFYDTKRADRRWQFYPSIFGIGFEETKKDLIFVNPVLEEFGIKIDMIELEEEYNKLCVITSHQARIMKIDYDIHRLEHIIGRKLSEEDKASFSESSLKHMMEEIEKAQVVRKTTSPECQKRLDNLIEKLTLSMYDSEK